MSKSMRSACQPGARVPIVWPSPSDAAASEVALMMASAGRCPPVSTRATISRNAALPSSRTFAVRREKPWYLMSFARQNARTSASDSSGDCPATMSPGMSTTSARSSPVARATACDTSGVYCREPVEPLRSLSTTARTNGSRFTASL